MNASPSPELIPLAPPQTAAPRPKIRQNAASPSPIRRLTLGLVLTLQALSALFFVSDIALSVLHIYVPPIPWNLREGLEIIAAIALVCGMGFGAHALIAALRAERSATERARQAALAFHDLLEERFALWHLTRAERDVALFALKGFNTAEIAGFRRTSEGTVKAQAAAIYRKAGVSGRGQLLSLFIEDLMTETPLPATASSSAPVALTP